MKIILIPVLLPLIQLPGTTPDPAYRFTDLGVFPLEPGVHPGDPPILPRDINNAGAIVSTARTLPYPAQGFRALLYYYDHIRNLGLMDGWYQSQGKNLNDYAQVSGDAGVSSLTYAFFWQEGAFVNLGSLGALGSYSADMNNAGQIVGWGHDEDLRIRAFRWTDGDMLSLGTLCDDCLSSQAIGVNDHGQVVGRALSESGSWHAFLWDETTGMTDLGTLEPGDSYSAAEEINDRGTVIGISGDESSGGTLTGFVAPAGRPMVALESPPSFCCSRPSDINESDQIVGAVEDSNGRLRAFIFDRGVMTDLNDLTSTPPGVVLREARAINDLGQIVGATDKGRGFLLTPNVLFINAPFPGTVDKANTIHLSGATARSQIRLFVSEAPGESTIPGCRRRLGLEDPEPLEGGISDHAGEMVLAFDVPAGLAGSTVYFQAVDVAGCRLSPVVQHTFR